MPRSLWGWIDRQTCGLLDRLRSSHSIWSAKTLGSERSTVVGKLRMISRPASGRQTSITASQTSREKSSSVSLKSSGEYSKPRSQPLSSLSAYFMTSRVPCTARSLHSSWFIPNTTRRNSGEVALYRWIVARGAPSRLSTVRLISSSRACTRTEMRTSSGIRSRSISLRTNAKSSWLATGNPTSISRYPMRTRRSNIAILRSGLMGLASDWLPSRRSVETQRGAEVMVLSGQRRPGRATGVNGW